MLTIKTNIDYKSLTPICSTKNALCEKILGDYELIKADFVPEELLHLMTQSPDVYYQEGQISNILNDNRVVTQQSIKVDVINNMLNRLMMTAVDKSSYRDTVYIENVLRKLGITDVNEFVTQVRNLTLEDKHTEKLLNLYYNNIDELRTVVSTVAQDRKQQKQEQHDEQDRETTFPLTIHNEIFNRLDTAMIYSELSDIYKQFPAATGDVRPESFAMAEQEKTSRNLILNSFRNYVRAENMPLTYRNYNIYEEGDNIRNESKGDNVVNRVTGAVLLNHIDKLISMGINNQHINGDEWFDFSKTFVNSSVNTLERLKESGEYSVNNELSLYESSTVNNVRNESEISLLTQLVHLSQDTSVFETDARESAENKLFESVHNYLNRLSQTNILRKSEYNQDGPQTTLYNDDRSVNVLASRTINNSVKNVNFRDNSVAGDAYNTFTAVEKTLNTENLYDNSVEMRDESREINVSQTDVSGDETKVDIQNNTQAYTQALKIINEQNLEKLTQLAGKMQQPQKPSQPGARRLDRSSAIMAAEDILNGVSPLDMEYLVTGEVDEGAGKTQYEKAVESVVSENTKEIFNVVRQYIDNPLKAIESGAVAGNDMGMLAAQINYLNRENAHKEPGEIINEEREAQETEIIRRIAEPVIKRETISERQQLQQETVNLVHKQTEVAIDKDEILEELHRQNVQINKTNETVQTLTDNVTKKNVEVHNFSTTTTEEITTDKVEKIVSDKFRDDMDEITQKVFDRLEKKLVTEQKRRGF